MDNTFPDLFDNAAAVWPDQLAVEGVERRVTFSMLRRLTNSIAHQIVDAGAPTESVIGVVSRDRFHTITAIIAALKAGCAYMVLDPRLPRKRLSQMVAVVTPYCYICDAVEVQLIESLTTEAHEACTRYVLLEQADEPVHSQATGAAAGILGGRRNFAPPNVAIGQDALCSIYFTSGSTGTPKAIAGRMSGIDHFLRWEIDALELEPSTRVAQVLPLAFDGSLMDFVALCCGGTLCLPPTDETVLDASAMARWLSSARIDILHYVPSMFRELISDDGNALEDLQLRYILLTGEKVLASDVRRWRNRCGDRTQLVNLYGPTETTLVKFVHFITADDADRGTIPIGRPMPGASALLLDAAGRPCTVGTAGEVYISTPYRSLGYWNRPDLTCERFVPNPFNDNPKDILYKTGDLARISENGDYEFLGRFDDQVKIRGIRIELAEIENIIRQHELVRDVAVIACNDQSNLPYLCAYVVTTRGLDESALHRHVVEHVPASMAPSMYKMVREIPRTYSGKADRRALTHIVNDAEPLAPRTPVEHAIARLWQELLGLEEIGVDDNFFTIGGHSLVAMRLLSRIKDTFQLDLALAEFVESPTISGQALAVTAGLLAQLEDGERSAMINEILTMSEDKVETALATET